jgi:hypothetical protein
VTGITQTLAGNEGGDSDWRKTLGKKGKNEHLHHIPINIDVRGVHGECWGLLRQLNYACFSRCTQSIKCLRFELCGSALTA